MKAGFWPNFDLSLFRAFGMQIPEEETYNWLDFWVKSGIYKTVLSLFLTSESDVFMVKLSLSSLIYKDENY